MRIIQDTDKELVLLVSRFKADTPLTYTDGTKVVKPLAEVKALAERMQYFNQPLALEHPSGAVPHTNDLKGYLDNHTFHNDHIDSHLHIFKDKFDPALLQEIHTGKWQISDGFDADYTLNESDHTYIQSNLFPLHTALTQQPLCSPSEGCGFVEARPFTLFSKECESHPPDTRSLYRSLCTINSDCRHKILSQLNQKFGETMEQNEQTPPPAPVVATESSGRLFTESQLQALAFAEKIQKLITTESLTSLLGKDLPTLSKIYTEALENRVAALEKELSEKTAHIAQIRPPPIITESANPQGPAPYTLIGTKRNSPNATGVKLNDGHPNS